ncbi:hypothetical protein BKA83DRAFT_2386787 [Pisolithus microcarpus]|nr:hypothetical protein BKA83DRAFT_2386787 [Pisolithus microcarpus]
MCATVPAVALNLSQSSNLGFVHIPPVEYSPWPLAYITSFKYMSNAAQIPQEGYAKYKGVPFKVLTLNRQIVVVNRQVIKKSTDDELSFLEAENDVGALTFRSILIEEALIGSATTVHRGRLSDS